MLRTYFISFYRLILSISFILLLLPASGQNFFISGGHDFSATLCETGQVLTWGKGGANIPTPFAGGLPSKIKQVEAGSGSHAIALGCDGKVYSWGGNGNGQLGHGTTAGEGVGQVVGVDGVGFLSNTRYINAASNASYAVLENGEVVAWGANDKGQLGNNSAQPVNSNVPVHVIKKSGGNLGNIVSVQGTDYGGVALAEDGTVWTWGENLNLALGWASFDTPLSRVASQVIKSDGKPLTGIVQISGGDTHMLALDGKGNVWSWGGDWGPGQLGQGVGYETAPYANRVAGGQTAKPFLEGVVYVSAGQAHSLAVLADGSVVSWGSNKAFGVGASGMEQKDNTGQLGIGLGPLPAAPDRSTEALGAQVPQYVLTAPGEKLTGIKTVASGDSWSFFVSGRGEVYGAGYNGNGQLGLNDNIDRGYATPITTFPTTCNVAQPCPTANLGGNKTKCASESIQLYAGSANSGYTYTWLLDGFKVSGGNNTGGSIYNATKNGKYKVSITTESKNTCGENCPVAVDSITITDLPTPVMPKATICKNSVSVDYTGIEEKRYEWYTKPTGGTALGTPTINPTAFEANPLTVVGNDTLFYVEDVSGFEGTVGPKMSLFSENNGSTNMADAKLALKFDAFTSFTIDSMTIGYSSYGCAGAKNIVINIKKSDGTVVATTSAAIPCLGDNITARIFAGLNIPKGTGYTMDAIGSDAGFALGWFAKGPANWLTEKNSLKGIDITGNYSTSTSKDPFYGTWASPAFFDWKVRSANFYPCGRIPVKVSSNCPKCQKPTSFSLKASAKSLCVDEINKTIQLTVENITPATPASDPASYIYRWFKDNDSIKAQTGTSLIVTADAAMGSGTYRVRIGHTSVTDGSGCYRDSSVTLAFGAAVKPGSLKADTTLCAGSVITAQSLTPGSGGGTLRRYIWESSPDGIFPKDTVKAASGENFSTGPLTQSIYYRRITFDPTCGDSATNIFHVTVLPSLKPKVTLKDSLPVCELDTNIPYTADTTNAGTSGTFRWYVNNVLQPAAVGKVANLSGLKAPSSVVKVVLIPSKDGKCYFGNDSAQVSVAVTGAIQPKAEITGAESICQGDEIVLTAKVQPSTAKDTLTWTVDGKEIADAKNKTTFATKDLKYGQKIRLNFKSGSQCATSPTATSPEKIVKVFTRPEAIIKSSKDTICLNNKNEVSTITANRIRGNPADQFTYSWYKDNSTLGKTGDSISTRVPGKYYLLINNSLPSCRDTSTTVTISAEDVRVSVSPEQQIDKGKSVQLEATPNGPWFTEWLKQDSLKIVDNPLKPIASPSKTTIYKVVATSSTGCTDSNSVRVIVFQPIRIPNIFSPNGDGSNDLWDIPGLESYPDVEVRIFNRLGNVVYKTRGYEDEKRWDGKVNGQPVPAATYYYVIDPQTGSLPVRTGYVVVIY